MVEASGVDEIVIEEGDLKVTVRKAGAFAAQAAAAVAVAPTVSADSGQSAATESSNGFHVVRSPMVATFYRASAPTADSFVEVGDTVTVGQTLCILEAMKLMNEMGAEVAGVVRAIKVENGQAVEYGQALFDIEPS